MKKNRMILGFMTLVLSVVGVLSFLSGGLSVNALVVNEDYNYIVLNTPETYGAYGILNTQNGTILEGHTVLDDLNYNEIELKKGDFISANNVYDPSSSGTILITYGYEIVEPSSGIEYVDLETITHGSQYYLSHYDDLYYYFIRDGVSFYRVSRNDFIVSEVWSETEEVYVPLGNGVLYQFDAYLNGFMPVQSHQISYYLGYQAGLSLGESSINQAYKAGYDTGKEEGKSLGYLEGIADALETLDDEKLASWWAGYDEGYSEGVDVGFSNGYDKGLIEQDAYGFGNFLGSLFVGIASIFSIELFGGITIGSIFLVPLVFGIIYFILGRRKE